MQHKTEAGIILAFGLVSAFVPALLLGDTLAAVQFAFAFNILFILPMIPWVLMLDWNAFERFALAAVLGVSGIPIMLFFIGVVHGPMNLITFLGVPLIVFVIGMVMLNRKNKHHAKAAEHHAPHHTAQHVHAPTTVDVPSSETEKK